MKQPINPHLTIRLKEITAKNKVEEQKLLRKVKAIKASYQRAKTKV